MNFSNRQAELELLNLTYQQVVRGGKMIVITGRRRIGKTCLAIQHALDKPHIYLFVSKKSELLLCEEYAQLIKTTFNIPVIGEIKEFKEIFRLLLTIAKEKPFVLIVDEFQEFFNINKSIYSDLQKEWDLHKEKSQIQVLFMGSVYSLMHKIFEDSKEALFGRADRFIHLKPFTPNEIYQILLSQGYREPSTVFDYYVFTGGVPKYIDLLVSNRAFTTDDIINFYLSTGSPLINEGRNVLIEEFGKDYGFYFSILELISSGYTSRGEIESVLQTSIGGYLDRLDTDYSVIRKFKPINATINAKLQKYHFRDNFLNFWFRFIYKNRTAVETENYEYIKNILRRDLDSFKGKLLESFYHELFAQSHQFNIMGSYWERDGQNEIDLIAVNEMQKKVVFAEIKLNKEKISLPLLREKAEKLVNKFYKNYDIHYLDLSMEDIKNYL